MRARASHGIVAVLAVIVLAGPALASAAPGFAKQIAIADGQADRDRGRPRHGG